MTILAARLDGSRMESWPLDDRAQAYGDGLFETIAVANGRPRLLELHRQRLEHGSRRLGLPIPPAMLWNEVQDLAATPGCGLVKIIWSRGSGRGYRPPAGASGRRLVMAMSAAAPRRDLDRGVRVRLCRTRLSSQPALAGLKHLNRLEQVLAQNEWQDAAIAEGLMMDHSGAVVEGTQSNLFIVREGVLWTPRLDQCGVAGIMRRVVMEHLAPSLGLEVRCTRISLGDLLHSDELFLTGSLIGIWPVAAVDCWSCPPGPVSRDLRAAWLALDDSFLHSLPDLSSIGSDRRPG